MKYANPREMERIVKGIPICHPASTVVKICSALLYLATQLPANYPSKGYFEEADDGDPSVCFLFN